MDTKRLTGYVSVIFTILVWSSTYISTKFLVKIFSPMEISLVRFSIGLIFLLIISPPKRERINLREELKIAGSGFTGMFLYYFLENLATKLTYASNVSIIVTTIPLFTVIIAPVFFKAEKFLIHYIWAFLLSFGGLLVISLSAGSLSGFSLKGDLTALIAAVVFSLYTLLLRSVHPGTDPVTLTRKTVFYGWLLILAVSFSTDNIPDIRTVIRLPQLWHFIFLGILASGICFITWAVSVRNLGAIRASQFIYLVPFITVTLSAVILHEKVSVSRIVGLFLILAGVIISQRKQVSVSASADRSF